MGKSVVPPSDEEEEDEALPVLRRSTRTKRPKLDSPGKKLRRVESLKSNGDIADATPTQTTQGASNEGSQDENTPSENTCAQAQRTEASRRRGRSKDAASPPKKRIPTSKSSIQGPAVPESLRAAIAQVVSQRQQLLSRQRSLSESDYDLSDIELPSSTPLTVPSNARPTDTPRSNRSEPGPSGLLPLFDKSHIFNEKPNLERKRAFFRAKELAFEQLKWQRENEFQQLGLDLLHREMEAREALAQQEFKIRRMRIRADIIQTMIRGGASIADIAERLELLEDVFK